MIRPEARPWRNLVQGAALVAVAYYLGALMGFHLRFPSSGISFFWPPTAILTAALLLTPPRRWGALLGGAFVAHAAAHAQNGVSILAWPVQFAANGLQAVLAAWLVRRYSDPADPFRNLQHAGAYIAGACFAAPAAASLVAASIYVNQGWAPDFAGAWSARTVSNAIAMLTLVPPIVMAWPYLWSKPGLPAANRVLELALILFGIVVSHAVVRQVDRSDSMTLLLALYAPGPFLLWATVRFGGLGLSGAILATTLLTISSALAGQGVFSAETPLEAVIGVQLFIALTAVPLILIAGLLEQNRAEHRALVEIERHNRATLRALPDLLFVQTRDGVYLEHYPRDRSDLLVAPEAFLGKNMREVLPPVLVEQFASAFQTVTADEPSVIEYPLNINGDLRHFEARFIGLDGDRVLSVVRDITERRRSEDALRESRQRYALATAAGGIGVWEVNLGTGAVAVEGGLAGLLGYTEDEIAGQLANWQRLIFPEDIEEFMAQLTSYAHGTLANLEIETRMRCKDGSVRWILSRGAFADRVNGAIRVTGTYADITARRQTEGALKEAHDALVRMGRVSALAELTASIAHELNQPLAAIASNANACLRWLKSSTREADLQGALKDVVADSHRASQIVQRTREMFTNRHVEAAPVDLNAIIRDVLELTGTRLRESSVRLETDLDEGTPPVHADGVQIKQVVLNMVLNAVDAMLDVDQGPRILRIGSRCHESGAMVTVRDNGSGFQSPDVERVFEPFYTTKADGIGIGLAISRSIVDAHGGSMWAEANATAGATFCFTLPAQARQLPA